MISMDLMSVRFAIVSQLLILGRPFQLARLAGSPKFKVSLVFFH
jgi:hypothetical protein